MTVQAIRNYFGGISDDGDGPVTSAWTPAEVSAGDTANVSVGADDTVRVLWEASGGGDTATLGKWTGPDA